MQEKNKNKFSKKQMFIEYSVALVTIGCLSPMVLKKSKFVENLETYDCFSTNQAYTYENNCSNDLESEVNQTTARQVGSSLQAIYSGENRAQFHEQAKFARLYYRNLETYYPENNVGNCGYVSIAMLISYYSLLWNPSFLPTRFRDGFPCQLDSMDDDTFDAPGTLDFPNITLWSNEYPYPANLYDQMEFAWSAYERATSTEELINYYNQYINYKTLYDDYINAGWSRYISRMINEETSIIGYLYDLATSIPDPNRGYNIIDFQNEPRTGLTLIEAKLILEKYFENIGLSNYVSVQVQDYSEFGYYEDYHYGILDEEIDHLANGQPILFGGKLQNSGTANEEDNGHIAVAYDYNPESDDIYGHAGWKGSSNRNMNFNYLFSSYDDFLYLTISPQLRHVHNRAFEYNGSLYCSCELSCHDHWLTDWFDYGDNAYHARQCSCGEIEYGRHFFVPNGIRKEKCFTCGKTRNASMM